VRLRAKARRQLEDKAQSGRNSSVNLVQKTTNSAPISDTLLLRLQSRLPSGICSPIFKQKNDALSKWSLAAKAAVEQQALPGVTLALHKPR
jgi:hypothetical protein